MQMGKESMQNRKSFLNTAGRVEFTQRGHYRKIN